MRNLFDQYQQAENRLTHSLLCSLDADRRLLHAFVRWITGSERRGAPLIVQGQSLPGQPEARLGLAALSPMDALREPAGGGY